MERKNLFKILTEIHDRVHDGFTYVHDDVNYGIKEHWGFPDDVDNFEDDCDGFAIACRQLIKEQHPALESRLVACQAETGEWHCVCAVGNMILDNRYYKVLTRETLEALGYKFHYVSGLEPGEPWQVLA